MPFMRSIREAYVRSLQATEFKYGKGQGDGRAENVHGSGGTCAFASYMWAMPGASKTIGYA